ncbi:Ig-like domain-containing protein [Gemmatimonas sp.]|uniref:Ig-like domain-containing protein n=1 Tax=Gemmatimonas sp. TaxID=1962908 RepID=UPI0039837947
MTPAMRAAVRVAGLMLMVACGGGGDPVTPDVAPAVLVSPSGGAATVAAGATLQLSARVTDKRAQLVTSPSVVWSSSTPTVAIVSSEGIVTATTVGSTTISAASLGATGTVSVTVTAGAPAKLFVRTQPVDVPSGTSISTAPVVEVRDALDNLVTAVGVPVSVSFATGVGTLGGVTTVTSVQGLATFSQLVLSGLAGPRTLMFSAGGIAPVNTTSFAISAGPAASLAFRVAPAGGGLNSPFVTQPVLDVLDDGGNLATNATLTVNASISAGGGTLTGATAQATNGVVTFTNLGVTGTGGARTLLFSAAVLPSLPISITPCDASRTPRLVLSATSRTLAGFALRTAVVDTLTITDANGSCTAVANLNTSVTYTGASGWLSATVLSNPLRLALRADPSALNTNTYQATVALTSTNAVTVNLPVTFNVAASITLRYGLATEKANELDVNGTLQLTPVVLNSEGVVITPPITYVSRSPSIATVAADGRITAQLGGRAWIVAQTTVNGGALDSVFVNVTRTSGPVLRADITRFDYTRNTPFSVTLSLDTRGSIVGAAQLVFTWPTELSTPSLLRLTGTVAGTVGSPVIVTDLSSGTTRISIASAAGMTGVITLGRFDFIPMQIGTSQFVLRHVELLDLNQQSLLGNATALQYPVVIK